eukprot:bmy_22564T0
MPFLLLYLLFYRSWWYFISTDIAEALLGARQGLPVFSGSKSFLAQPLPPWWSRSQISSPPTPCFLCATGDPPASLAADDLGLHRVPGRLRVVQLHHPGLGRVGRRAAGLHRRHKYVSRWFGGHHLPGHHPHQHLLPEGQPLGHRALQRWHGHRQRAPQAGLLLLRLPDVPGARGFPWTFTGAQCLPDD